MNPASTRVRSLSGETPRLQQPVSANLPSASIADANQLGIRIIGLKSFPVKEGARLTEFLACASALQRMPKQFVSLLAGELRAACATLPKLQERYASNALDSVAPLRS